MSMMRAYLKVDKQFYVFLMAVINAVIGFLGAKFGQSYPIEIGLAAAILNALIAYLSHLEETAPEAAKTK